MKSTANEQNPEQLSVDCQKTIWETEEIPTWAETYMLGKHIGTKNVNYNTIPNGHPDQGQKKEMYACEKNYFHLYILT